MRILVLSDLGWDQHLRLITETELLKFKYADFEKPRYQSIKRYLDIIINEKPEVVIFAGDVTGDGSCGHGFHYAFLMLLTYVESRKIQCYYISGNHDEDKFYELVQDYSSDFQFVNEISGKLVSTNGVNFYGINFFDTLTKTRIRELKENTLDQNIDILVAHSQLKRRIHLFDFQPSYIFTGHYDRKLFTLGSTAFVALDNDFSDISYSTLQLGDENILSLKVKTKDGTIFSLQKKVHTDVIQMTNSILKVNGRPTFDLRSLESTPHEQLDSDENRHLLYLKYLRGTNYKKLLRSMMNIKNGSTTNKDLKPVQMKGMRIIDSYKVSESLIEDYLGDVL